MRDAFQDQIIEMLSSQQALKASSGPHKAKCKRSPPPRRQALLLRMTRMRLLSQIKLKRGPPSTFSWGGDSLSSPSQSDREEGELSGDEGHDSSALNKVYQLCPGELYLWVLIKAAKMIEKLGFSKVASPDDQRGSQGCISGTDEGNAIISTGS